MSLWAIEQLVEDRALVRSCTCVIRITKGLPCRCEVQRCLEEDRLLYRRHLHRFWATLDYNDPPDRAEWENEARAERDIWRETVEDVESLGEAHVRAATRLLQSQLYPDAEGLYKISSHRMLRKADLHDGKMRGNRRGGRR